MNLTHTNEPEGQATAEQLLAQQEARIVNLILMRSRQGLPYPRWTMNSTGAFGLRFGPLADLTAWNDALTADGATIDGSAKPFRCSTSDETYMAQILNWQDVQIYLRAYEAEPSAPTPPLDADTVAGLEAIAAPAEQTLAVDYGQDVPEVDEVAETTTAVAEPVISDDARTILDGLNARLDDRRDPVLGIDWAIRQPEVASADGPNVEGEYQVELADFTLIGWQPAERAWAVTVSDDIEGGESRIANREVSR